MYKSKIMYRRFFKRAIDIMVSAGVLIVFSPILLTVAVLLHFSMKAQVYFFPRASRLQRQTFQDS